VHGKTYHMNAQHGECHSDLNGEHLQVEMGIANINLPSRPPNILRQRLCEKATWIMVND